MKNKLTSLELSKELDSLGVKVESDWYWIYTDNEQWEIALYSRGYQLNTGKNYIRVPDYGDKEDYGWRSVDKIYPAYSVAELGELLPCEQDGGHLAFFSGKAINGWYCEVKNYGNMPYSRLHIELRHDTEANARAKMLIYLIKKYIDVTKLK